MKRIIRLVLGASVVVLAIETIRREASQFTREAKNGFLVKDQMAEFWFWLSCVMEEYAGLNYYILDRRTFGNSVWEIGIKEHIQALQMFLDRFPTVLQDPSDDFSLQCVNHKDRAVQWLIILDEAFKQRDRKRITNGSRELGGILSEIHTLGTKRRIARMFREI